MTLKYILINEKSQPPLIKTFELYSINLKWKIKLSLINVGVEIY